MVKAFNFQKNEIENMKFKDIDKIIVNFLVHCIEEAANEGEINWDKFTKYCKEFGTIDPPNILTIPISVLHRCIKEAREKWSLKHQIGLHV